MKPNAEHDAAETNIGQLIHGDVEIGSQVFNLGVHDGLTALNDADIRAELHTLRSALNVRRFWAGAPKIVAVGMALGVLVSFQPGLTNGLRGFPPHIVLATQVGAILGIVLAVWTYYHGVFGAFPREQAQVVARHEARYSALRAELDMRRMRTRQDGLAAAIKEFFRAGRM